MSEQITNTQGAKKVEKETVYLQFDGREVCLDTIRQEVLDHYESVKKGKDPAKNTRIYLKPEDSKAYYVINDDFAGEVGLALN